MPDAEIHDLNAAWCMLQERRKKCKGGARFSNWDLWAKYRREQMGYLKDFLKKFGW